MSTPGVAQQNSKEQAHAQITHASEPQMRGALAEVGEPLPQRRDEKRQM